MPMTTWRVFGLRAMAIAIAFLCVALAPISHRMRMARKRQDLVEDLRRSGCYVSYHFEQRPDNLVPVELDEMVGSPKHSRWVGVDFFHDVKFVGIYDRSFSDLNSIGPLSKTRWLDARDTQITNIAILSRFQELEFLMIAGTAVDDLDPLSGLAALKWLDVSRTNVSDLRSLKNLHSLRHLNIADTNVSSLSPIIGLRGMEELVISKDSRGHVAKDVATLREVLPGLVVKRQEGVSTR